MTLVMDILKKAKLLAAQVVFTGEKVDAETVEMRKAACQGCEFFDEKYRECKACGCMLDIKWALKTHTNPMKFRDEITHCVHGKWNDVEIANVYRLIDGKKLIDND